MKETQERQVPSFSWEGPLEEEMATQSRMLAWRIPWTEEPAGFIVHGVSQSQTQLKRLSTHTCTPTSQGCQVNLGNEQ